MRILKLTLVFLLLFTTLAFAFDVPTENYTADEYDVLLIHADQADGTAGTDIIDSADSKTITCVGNAQVDTAQYKDLTGSTGSILLDGTGDYLSLDDSTDWDYGTDPMTADWWIRFDTFPIASNYSMIYSQVNGGSWHYMGLYNDTGTYRWNWYVAGVINMNVNTTISEDTWYHIAFVRSGSSFMIFQDGTQVGSTTTSAGSMLTIAAVLTIGEGGGYVHNGWIDELRVGNGVARDWIDEVGQFIRITKIRAKKFWKNLLWKFKDYNV